MVSAIQSGDTATVQALVGTFGDRIVNNRETVHWDADTGRSYCPIHIAIECNSPSMLKLLLDSGAKPAELVIDTQWNSRADQYLAHTTYTLEEWARHCRAGEEIMQLIRPA